MPTVIKEASSVKTLNDAMEVRYKILEESGRSINRIFSTTKKVSDHFDVYPETQNVVAYDEGEAIANVRSVFYPEGGVDELDEIFNYRESEKSLKGLCYFMDIVGIIKNFSGEDELLNGLLGTLFNLLSRKQVAFVFFNVPDDLKTLCDKLGFNPISDGFQSPILNKMIYPSVINLQEFYGKLIKSVTDREILRFQETFYKVIFRPGEILIAEGDKGTTAFLVESGEVDILKEKDGEIVSIHSMGSGNLIGEIGLMTSEPRTASIMAKTTCSCMAFDRTSFMEVMYKHPGRMLDMFKIFSKRLSAANQRLAEKDKGK